MTDRKIVRCWLCPITDFCGVYDKKASDMIMVSGRHIWPNEVLNPYKTEALKKLADAVMDCPLIHACAYAHGVSTPEFIMYDS